MNKTTDKTTNKQEVNGMAYAMAVFGFVVGGVMFYAFGSFMELLGFGNAWLYAWIGAFFFALSGAGMGQLTGQIHKKLNE
jgi:hypothetical protein